MPRIVDHDRRREALLEQSFGLFARLGYASLSMRGLADQLGVSTGTLYHYFDGKDALFQAMVRQATAKTVALATQGISADLSRGERIAALGRFLEENASPLQQTLQITLEYQRHHSGEAAQGLLSDTLTEYTEALAEQLDIADEGVARALLSFLLGALVQRILDPDAVDLGAHMRLLSVVAELAELPGLNRPSAAGRGPKGAR
jgi:AcrR family transcriptional regulator